jgi:predicted acetyltransferase
MFYQTNTTMQIKNIPAIKKRSYCILLFFIPCLKAFFKTVQVKLPEQAPFPSLTMAYRLLQFWIQLVKLTRKDNRLWDRGY